jgi:hypothetical protein
MLTSVVMLTSAHGALVKEAKEEKFALKTTFLSLKTLTTQILTQLFYI